MTEPPRYIVCELPDRRVRLAWLSLQPEGWISFGLNDRMFIAPQSKTRVPIWNAYNRVKAKFLIESDPSALESISNPHFTYHPPGHFHLRETGGERVFEAIARLEIALEQEGGLVPWIRATTRPLGQIQQSRGRSGQRGTDIIFHPIAEKVSASIAVDFCRADETEVWEHDSCVRISWYGVGVRMTVGYTYPQIPKLGWFHSY